MSNLERSPELTLTEETPRPPEEPLQELITAREVDVGEGTPVRRLLPRRRRSTVGAWCFLDHWGPLDVAGRPGLQVAPHPHIGLQTVTWLLEGEVLHRDSLANRQMIRPGQLNLMTAGRGVAHSEESPPNHPPILHGVQLWTALPERASSVDPDFEHLAELPSQDLGAARVTVLVGELLGLRSPARTYSDLVAAEVTVWRDTDHDLRIRRDLEHAVLALSGRGSIDGVSLEPGALLYLGKGRDRIGVAGGAGAQLLLLGGEPLHEPLFMWWNFVAHRPEDIVEARADWQAGRRFGEVDSPLERLDAPPLPPGRLRPRV